MLTAILAALAVFCASKWVFWRTTVAVMMWYIQETGNPIPSNEKMREGFRWVGKQMVMDLVGRRKKR